MQFSTWISALLVAILACGDANGERARELDAYTLVADHFIARPADAPTAQVFYTSDQKLLSAKLAEYGQKLPDNVNFPQGGLFVILVSDHLREAFKSLSMVDAQREVVIDLQDDNGANPPDHAGEGKKSSRLLLVATAPLKGVKGFAVATADGARHEAKSEELKK